MEILASAGCVAPEEEAAELIRAAGADGDLLVSMVERRTKGEPLAWLTGRVRFSSCTVRVDAGVYVPRYQTELLVRRAVALLGLGGTVVDLCTGSGAIAAALKAARPDLTVIGSDIDPVACACAAANGVEAYCGDLDDPLPRHLVGRVDLVTAVPPYVPDDELQYLPRDVLAYEPRVALDGGANGTAVLERVVEAAARLLRVDGHLVMELGGDQDSVLDPVLRAAGFDGVRPYFDEDGDLRGVSAVYRRS